MKKVDKKELTWQEVRKNLEFSEEEEELIRNEKEIIQEAINVRKENGLSQQELSEKTGIKQSAIARIEKYKNSPMVSTLIKMLLPMGYTLKVVPIKKQKAKIIDKNK